MAYPAVLLRRRQFPKVSSLAMESDCLAWFTLDTAIEPDLEESIIWNPSLKELLDLLGVEGHIPKGKIIYFTFERIQS